MEMQVNLSPLLRKIGGEWGGGLRSQGQNREAGQVCNGLAEQDRLLAGLLSTAPAPDAHRDVGTGRAREVL